MYPNKFMRFVWNKKNSKVLTKNIIKKIYKNVYEYGNEYYLT